MYLYLRKTNWNSVKNKPALRLPEGLFVAPNPNDDEPVALLPKAELLPNPIRIVVKTCTVKELVTKTQQFKVLSFYD